LVLSQKVDSKIMEPMSINIMGFNKHLVFMLKVFGIFIFVPVIGTFLHELGHFLVAILNGYET